MVAANIDSLDERDDPKVIKFSFMFLILYYLFIHFISSKYDWISLYLHSHHSYYSTRLINKSVSYN